MKILIFRIAKGEPGGTVNNSCPINFKKRKESIEKKLHEIIPEKINYKTNGYKDYLDKELWELNRLRQGWGIPGLDLRLGEEEWIENYILGCRQYWDIPLNKFKHDSICHDAAGRFKMFNETIGKVDVGDIIIIPTHSNIVHHDSKNYTVATIDGKYYFDLDKKYNDFAHVLPIKNLKVISYDSLIRPMDFTGYYQRAVTELKQHHKLYERINSMLKIQYM